MASFSKFLAKCAAAHRMSRAGGALYHNGPAACPVKISRLWPILILILCAISLGACQKTTKKVLTKLSQKTSISQGNLMFREDIARIRLGMSMEEVQFILGSPLVKGSFEENRWYYLFYLNLEPFPEDISEMEETLFSGKEGSAKWQAYWSAVATEPTTPSPKEVQTADVDGVQAEDEQESATDTNAENENTTEENGDEDSERITTIRRDRFVEAKKGYIGGRKVVFYGRMSLDFENRRLKSIGLLETPRDSDNN